MGHKAVGKVHNGSYLNPYVHVFQGVRHFLQKFPFFFFWIDYMKN